MARIGQGPRLKRRGKYWYVVGSKDGRSFRHSTSSSDRSYAETILASYLIERGENRQDPRCAILFNQYLFERGPKINLERAKYCFNRLEIFFSSLCPSEINDAKIDAYTSFRISAGAKPATIARELTALSAALRHAEKEGRIDKAPRIHKPASPPPKDRWLTKDESARLIQSCPPHLRLFVLIALSTGARRGAILDLDWSQVDLPNRRIDFNQPGRAQTAKRRPVVPIGNAIAAALQTETSKEGPVIKVRGSRIISIKTAFRAACKRAGLSGVTPHTLRHTAATWMAQAGVPLNQIAGMLGHSIQRTTELYIKHSPDFMGQAVAALDAAIGAELALNTGTNREKSAPNSKKDSAA